MFRRIALAFSGGLLAAAAFPPYHLAFALPFGMAALFVAVSGVSPKVAFYLGYLFGVVFFGATLYWLSAIFGPAVIALISTIAAFPAIAAAVSVGVSRRVPSIPDWLVFAIAWTGVEYYRSEPFILSFGWMGLGYALAGSAIPARIASVVGSYGLSFLVAASSAAVAKRRWTIIGGALVGWLGLVYIPLPKMSVRDPMNVRLVQAQGGDTDQLKALSKADGPRPDVLVWPEYSFAGDPERNPIRRDEMSTVARDTGAIFVFGAEDQFDLTKRNGYFNTAYVMSPDGSFLGKHVKNHLVHFFVDGTKGTDASAIATPVGRLGVAICFDLDYPDVARRVAADDAEVLLVPNMDPESWGPVQHAQHRLTFQMRANETGLWLGRADVAGGTSAVAPDGSEVAHVKSADPATLDVIVGRVHQKTWFVRGGWLFGPACFGAALALVLAAVASAVREVWRRR